MAEASETPFLLTRAPMSAVDEEVVTPLVKGMDFLCQGGLATTHTPRLQHGGEEKIL